MEETAKKTQQERKVEELHWEIQQWKSEIQFLDDEVLFIKRLLDSYVFEPNTPNLFERIEIFKKKLTHINEAQTDLASCVSKHENNLAGMLEYTDASCDMWYYQKHDVLQEEVNGFIENFRELKSSIFNYAGGVLKKRRP